jgi:NADP-dependent 3-hydroxy acid dehydrogenase YdfG
MAISPSRIALVTGATSGIGEAIARKFVAAGIAVVGNGRNRERLTQLQNELGSLFVGVAGDAVDGDVIASLFETALTQFSKPVDLVVVNAGRGLGGSVQQADLNEFQAVLNINVSGALALMQQAAPRLVAQQKNQYPNTAADIVVIGSVVGRHISPFSAVYGASKFAVHALAEGLRREIGPQGVRVTLVEPAIVVSGFQNIAGYSDATVQGFHDRFGPLLVGDDVAEAIYHLINLPPHVHISDLVIRPTRQDYP